VSSQAVGAQAYVSEFKGTEFGRAGGAGRVCKQQLEHAVTTTEPTTISDISGEKDARDGSSLISSLQSNHKDWSKGRYLDVLA
jgi:hypothetical protein